MPRITVKTNTFVLDKDKCRIVAALKKAIELIPCEKGSFVMTDFEDEAFMLFGDEKPAAPCASIEIAIIEDAFRKYDKKVFEEILFKATEAVMRYANIPEDRIFAYYRNSPLWSFERKNIIGSLLKL